MKERNKYHELMTTAYFGFAGIILAKLAFSASIIDIIGGVKNADPKRGTSLETAIYHDPNDFSKASLAVAHLNEQEADSVVRIVAGTIIPKTGKLHQHLLGALIRAAYKLRHPTDEFIVKRVD